MEPAGRRAPAGQEDGRQVRPLIRGSLFVAGLLITSVSAPQSQAAGERPPPQVPCAGEAYPGFAAPGELLNVEVWQRDELPPGWQPPACTGLKPGPLKTVFAGAGRFDEPGGQAAIVGRLAEVTGLLGVKYWSDSQEGWYQLFEDVSALSGPDRESRRDNFTNDELGAGRTLHFLLDEDHLMWAVIYRLRIIENRPDRMVFEMTNVNGMGVAIFTAVDAGQFQQYHVIERETGDTWRYYGFSRVSRAAFLAFMSPKSFKNKTQAFYRYVAGIPTDREPPAAR